MRGDKKFGHGSPLPSFGQNPKEQKLFFGMSSLTADRKVTRSTILGVCLASTICPLLGQMRQHRESKNRVQGWVALSPQLTLCEEVVQGQFVPAVPVQPDVFSSYFSTFKR